MNDSMDHQRRTASRVTMEPRMDIVSPRPGKDGKNYFTKIGSAWPMKNGGWSLTFDALPCPAINDKGVLETRALMMPPRDNSGPSLSSRASSSAMDGDGIPF